DKMKKIIYLFAILSIALIAYLLIGCTSKSTDSSTDNNLEDLVDFAGEGNLTYDLGIVDISYALIDQHYEDGVAKRSSTYSDEVDFLQIAVHDSSNYWHIFSCSAVIVDDYNDTTYFSGTDSIRFGTPLGYTYFPDSTINSIDMHWHFDAIYGGLEEYGNIVSRAAINLATNGYASTQAIFNGALSDSINLFFEDTTGACGMSMYFDQLMTNLVIDSASLANGYCPPSGEIDFDFALDINCEGTSELSLFNMQGEFTANMDFNGTSVTMTVNDGNSTYTEVQSCVGNSPIRNAIHDF
ncbi:MAG: hypothetical protein ABIJ45_05440, partial [Candidatus Zixiibacteriota bacterium]